MMGANQRFKISSFTPESILSSGFAKTASTIDAAVPPADRDSFAVQARLEDSGTRKTIANDSKDGYPTPPRAPLDYEYSLSLKVDDIRRSDMGETVLVEAGAAGGGVSIRAPERLCQVAIPPEAEVSMDSWDPPTITFFGLESVPYTERTFRLTSVTGVTDNSCRALHLKYPAGCSER